MKHFCDSYVNEKALLPFSHLLSTSPFSRFFSFFPGFFEPACLLKTHVYICWASDPLFLPLGPDGLFCYLFCQFFMVLIIGLFCLLGFHKWPSTFSPLNIWKIPSIHMWMKRRFCPSLIFFLLLLFRGSFFFFKLWTPSYSYIYPPSCCEQGCLFEFPSLAIIFKTEPPLH